jgi:hypothetical protein
MNANNTGVVKGNAVETCLWTEDSDTIWSTTCGESFLFDDGDPEENGFIYCCYCGKKLESKKFEFDNDDGEQ